MQESGPCRPGSSVEPLLTRQTRATWALFPFSACSTPSSCQAGVSTACNLCMFTTESLLLERHTPVARIFRRNTIDPSGGDWRQSQYQDSSPFCSAVPTTDCRVLAALQKSDLGISSSRIARVIR
ncbi:hypothetical protein ASPSYDRAFT_560552 [Aspergillus sydowii CBS 593.65]|uniref:Uncharacterized protein n=1 Tax=Aspergillus sydowii CBS 593.65 TaxID=1036612 RepID=A0A1L9T077_9EURO|nr:uncharacterized protein ASPSYDRAFT_560552 [Aspergillus sydowii CBS 593.65]OJJ52797.1 hypothetical protein ASPSYDRAFT_560552 [Aspergillus sydowii CBS 593.65]